MLVACPYGDCTFTGTEDEVDDHIAYLQGVGDPEHDAERRR